MTGLSSREIENKKAEAPVGGCWWYEEYPQNRQCHLQAEIWRQSLIDQKSSFLTLYFNRKETPRTVSNGYLCVAFFACPLPIENSRSFPTELYVPSFDVREFREKRRVSDENGTFAVLY